MRYIQEESVIKKETVTRIKKCMTLTISSSREHCVLSEIIFKVRVMQTQNLNPRQCKEPATRDSSK